MKNITKKNDIFFNYDEAIYLYKMIVHEQFYGNDELNYRALLVATKEKLDEEKILNKNEINLIKKLLNENHETKFFFVKENLEKTILAKLEQHEKNN